MTAGKAEGAWGRRAQEPLWHTCPFCLRSRALGGPGGAGHAGDFQRLRVRGDWGEGGKSQQAPPPSLAGSQATEEICFWSSCSPSGSPMRGWRFLSSRWYLAMREAYMQP